MLIGILMLLVVAIIMFAAVAVDVGIKGAIAVFSGTALAVAWIVVACSLIAS